jgi:O-antigen ligase
VSKIKANREDKLLSKILFAGFFITFVISPTIKDPINSPKLWALLLLASWLIPSFFEGSKNWTKTIEQRNFYVILQALAIALIIASIFSENKYRALFGESQRRNGLLAYVALIIFAAIASKVDIAEKNQRFFQVIFAGTLILTAYGFLQNFGYDFVAWSNQYSPVIGTLGNPNFMGAILATLSMILLPVLFLQNFNLKSKISFSILIALNFLVTYFTNALQGLLNFIFGATMFLLVTVYFRFKKLGLIGLLLFLMAVVVAMLGIFQKGPLASLLYKGSVTLRGYYWDAGIKMFQEKPLLGVGIDNYGLYFNEVRNLEYPLKFGYFVTSNNAHNLPIQLLATGGFLVGGLYLIMVFFIFAVAIRKLRKVSGGQKVILTGLMVSYSVFQLQSFVSIDNIGVSIWGWLIAGLIVGFNSSKINDLEVNAKIKIKNSVKSDSSAKTLMFSWALVTVSFVLVALLYQGEKKTYDLDGYLGGTSGPVEPQVLNLINETLDTPLIEPSYKMGIADKLMIRGLSDQAMDVITDLVNYEPRNLDYLTTRAFFAEYLNDFEMAITDREKISRLNPYNAINYKFLVASYLKTGRMSEAKIILDKVNSFAPNSEIAKEISNSISDFEKK